MTEDTMTRLSPRRLETLTLIWWAALAALVVALVARTDGPATAGGPLRWTPVPSDVTLLVLAGIGVVAAGRLRWGLARSRGARAAVVAVVGVVLAGCLAVVDATFLAALGYLPALLVGALVDASVRADLAVLADPVLGLQAAVLVGAVLLVAATVAHLRAGAGACRRCGRRPDGDPAWTTPDAAARWGRTAALVAAAIPAVYAIVRLAWVVGIPLGVTPEALVQIRTEQNLGAVGLGAFALVGAVLTLGLYQRWGEVFPRWMLGLAGRRVPVGFAVVPATLVAVAVLPAAISMVPLMFQPEANVAVPTTWGAWAPIVLWPLWSVALGAATYAYWLRRRGTCRRCRRG